WLISSDKRVLVLRGSDEIDRRFAIDNSERLTLLDPEGRITVVGSPRDHVLRRSDAVPALQPQLALRGLYNDSGDAATFSECLTGLDLPIAPSPAANRLQSAYLSGRGAPGVTE